MIRVFTLVILGILLCGPSGRAQENAYHSVLSQHTWFRLSVAHEGVYKLDNSTLQLMGINMETLNPNEIRIFGNPSGPLPERNSEARHDDLNELAIYVSGADDGNFDADDYVLFYAQEPTRWKLTGMGNNYKYERERNYYSDTTYYYLCVDSGVEGLRVVEKPTLPVEEATTVITEFPDFVWHEEEMMSPYSIGQNWFGEKVTASDPELTMPFVFPNLVKEKSLLLKASVLGRCKSNPVRYHLWVDNNHLVDNFPIAAYGNSDNKYGTVSSTEKQMFLENDSAVFSMIINSEDESAVLYLDYVEIYGWRKLIRVGNHFPFRLIPNQFGDGESAIWVQNANNRFWLWDVTEPLRPQLQEGRLTADNLVFAIDENIERRYFMFDPDYAFEVSSWTHIANQDVHAITDADMLIITHRSLWQQANALADFHATHDNMRSVVVDVNEIYNEFSTGNPDPTGIRDFVRMVYRRSAGNLKYLTLFGRASFDFRDLLGYGLNLVPTYETMDFPENLNASFCTDDYFGLMDDSEGLNSTGYLDLGIGRISVSTPEEAEVALDKIRLYYDLAVTQGEWKTDFVFLADDEKNSYVSSNESYNAILDTVRPSLNISKVYCGAYPHVNTSTGVEIPQANADLMNTLNRGVFMMSYSGHGGVKGLTGDNVFTVSDIKALQNFGKLPLVFTATCEFSKYDDPLLVSAGEHLFMLPEGGAIAMITTSRPTYGFQNDKIGKVMSNLIVRRDEAGRWQRIGDVYRMSKCHPINYSSGSNVNIRFLLLGDPALRIGLPEEEIVALKINGKNTNLNEEILLYGMSMVNLEGEVRTAQGYIDTQFNGEIRMRLYDKKSNIFVETDDEGIRNVQFYKDVLYRGRASVRNGRFTISFQVPKDINLDFGSPRFSFYAYDSIRQVDAMGYFDNLILGGTDPAAFPDDEGPRINFYWNTPDFTNGDVVERQGVLYADFYDAQGIYHYDFSLGRNIMLNSNLPAYDNMILNEAYEPALDDFRRGRVAIPISDLTPGTYEFRLKAWDLHDNSSEAKLWFVIDDDVFLAQVRNFPNPFSEETYFTMAHFGEDGIFDVTIEVFDLLGRNVTRLSRKVTSSGNMIEPIRWDGKDNSGNPLRTGVYLYRLTFTDGNGNSRTVSQRVMVSR